VDDPCEAIEVRRLARGVAGADGRVQSAGVAGEACVRAVGLDVGAVFGAFDLVTPTVVSQVSPLPGPQRAVLNISMSPDIDMPVRGA
jgi:hypothetical protein